MNHTASPQKTTKQTEPTSKSDASAGPDGLAIAPPSYGLDMADQQPIQRMPEEDQANKTGLPDHLKSGLESLSGLSMNDVKVHYNSAKPAQLQALAYTQGTDIHMGPGQDRHLPHEAWHVVQQKQGRVKPAFQIKDVAINNDQDLEREADTMGSQADHGGGLTGTTGDRTGGASSPANVPVIQRAPKVPEITEAEEAAIVSYVGSGYTKMNIGLISGKFSEDTATNILAVNSGLWKMMPGHKYTGDVVYRSDNFGNYSEEARKPYYTKGGVVTRVTFTSTSKNSGGVAAPSPHQLEIRKPKIGVDLSAIRGVDNSEAEVLFPRNLRLHIIKPLGEGFGSNKNKVVAEDTSD
jgi:hypothetical protein